MKRLWTLYIIFIPVFLRAQLESYPLDERYFYVIQRVTQSDSVFSILWNPIIGPWDNSYPVTWKLKKGPIRYLIRQNNFDYQDNDYSVHLNLLGNLCFGSVRGDSTQYYRNTRGFEIFGTLGKKVFYYTKYLENQAVFVPYVREYIDSMIVVPGEGWWKRFGTNGKDYGYAMGYVVYRPIKDISLEIGHGKNFIGQGYRSLILSDNSFVYPYLKVRYSHGRFAFVNMWTEMFQFHTVYYFYHYPKHASFTTFSYLSPHWEASLVIATMWKTSDYQSYVNHFPLSFFLPPIAPMIYGLDSENNSFIGVNVSMHLRPVILYGQLVIDKLDLRKSLLNTANRYAYQIGIRSYDILQNRINNLRLGILTEYNLIRPYTYASRFTYQGFYHYNQPLAHPWGAGLRENIFQLRLLVYNVELVYNYSRLAGGSPGSGQSNIFTTSIPVRNIKIGEENGVLIKHNTFIFSFLLNYHTGLKFFYGFDIRDFKTTANIRTFYKFVGLSTALGRFYYDF